MSLFYGILSGARGGATRTGNKNSGLQAIANSWDIGARITLDQPRADIIKILLELTSGSNDSRLPIIVNSFEFDTSESMLYRLNFDNERIEKCKFYMGRLEVIETISTKWDGTQRAKK